MNDKPNDDIKVFSSIKDAFEYLVKGEGWSELSTEQRKEIRRAKSDFVYDNGISEERMLKYLNKFCDVDIKIKVKMKK